MFQSKQAISLSVVFVIVILAFIILSIIQKTFKGMDIVWYVLILLYGLLVVYDTDCLVIGGCNVWSWIRTVLHMILPIVILVLKITFIRSLQKEKKQQVFLTASPSPSPSTMK